MGLVVFTIGEEKRDPFNGIPAFGGRSGVGRQFVGSRGGLLKGFAPCRLTPRLEVSGRSWLATAASREGTCTLGLGPELKGAPWRAILSRRSPSFRPVETVA